MRIPNTTKETEWKNNITKYGRQFVDNLSLYEEDDDTISYQQSLGYIGTFDEGDIIRINYSINSGLFKCDMATLTVEISNKASLINEITKNRLLSYSLSVDNESGNVNDFPTCNYGFFVIKKIEKLKDKDTILLTCYDEMIRTMVPYNKPLIAYIDTHDTTFVEGKTYYILSSGRYVEFTGSRTGSPQQLNLKEYSSPHFPIKLEYYFSLLAQNLKMGWYFADINIPNKDNYIQKDPYVDDDGNDLGYTYRDIFEDVAEACGCRIVTKTTVNNNQRYHYYQMVRMSNNLIYTQNYGEEYFNEEGVSIGEKYGPINSLIISNTESTKNVYYPDEIPENPVSVKITNNRILEQNDANDYIEDIYNKVNGLEYYSNDLQSKGIGLLEVGDRYRITIKGTTYNCIMFNDELIRTTGLKENIHTDNPEHNVEDIEYINNADKTEITSNLAYIKVNENSQLIKNIINGTQALDELNVNGDVTINGKLIIQKDGDHNKGLYDSAGNPIIRDWQNNDLSLDATGRNLYLGYRNTTGINFLDGKASIDSNGDTTIGGDLILKNNLNYVGKTNSSNINGNYLRLFTINTPDNWKSISVFFTLSNTQNDDFSQLNNLYCKRDSSSVAVTHFKTLNFAGNLIGYLYAIQTSSTKIEVYLKCSSTMTPTINILANSIMNYNGTLQGSIDVDMSTIVSSLPSGTQSKITGFDTYSTTERLVGTWIDGKPLYRKVVKYTNTSTIGSSSSVTNISIPHGISNIRQPVKCEMAKNTGHFFPNMGGTNVSYGTCITQVDTTNINLRIINDTWGASTWYFILEYTKSTD